MPDDLNDITLRPELSFNCNVDERRVKVWYQPALSPHLTHLVVSYDPDNDFERSTPSLPDGYKSWGELVEALGDQEYNFWEELEKGARETWDEAGEPPSPTVWEYITSET